MLVAKGNYSRIGIARVQFDESGDPCGVERLGIALEPEADDTQRNFFPQLRTAPPSILSRKGLS